MTTDQPQQRPEGKLIQEALETSGRSVRQVAPLAGVSEARWRQLVKGTLKTGPFISEQIAPAGTLARMAQAVGVTPEQLAEVGREDAAVVLAGMAGGVDVTTVDAEGNTTISRLKTYPQAPRAQVDEIDLIYASTTMTARQKLQRIRMVLQLRAQVEAEEGRTQQEAPTTDAEASMEQPS